VAAREPSALWNALADGEGTVAQDVLNSPSQPLATLPPRKPMNRMTPRQREAYITQYQAIATELQKSLLAAIAKYPGGMEAVRRKVRYHDPPTGGGLPELIRRLTDHRQILVTLQYFTVRQLCDLLNDESFMELWRVLWPEQYERELREEEEERARAIRREQEAAAEKAARMAQAGIGTEASFLEVEAIATRWGSVLVRFGTLCMTLGMKNDSEARAQANRLVLGVSLLTSALGKPGMDRGGAARELAALDAALDSLRKGPLALAVSDLSRELMELKAAIATI